MVGRGGCVKKMGFASTFENPTWTKIRICDLHESKTVKPSESVSPSSIYWRIFKRNASKDGYWICFLGYYVWQSIYKCKARKQMCVVWWDRQDPPIRTLLLLWRWDYPEQTNNVPKIYYYVDRHWSAMGHSVMWVESLWKALYLYVFKYM